MGRVFLVSHQNRIFVLSIFCVFCILTCQWEKYPLGPGETERETSPWYDNPPIGGPENLGSFNSQGPPDPSLPHPFGSLSFSFRKG
jgi:hypothetical protein